MAGQSKSVVGMVRRKSRWWFLVLMGVVGVSVGARAQDCARSVQWSAVNSEWTQFLYQDGVRFKEHIAILPFTPVLAHRSVPSYFPYVFPALFSEYWSNREGAYLVDWRLADHVARSVAASPGRAMEGEVLQSVAENLGVHYLIVGTFDLYQQRIKIFPRFYDAQNKRFIGREAFALESQLDGTFMPMMGNLAVAAAETFRFRLDGKRVQVVNSLSPRFAAIESYIQGIVHTTAYDPNHLAVAKVWFKGAIGKEYRFYPAYRELARAHFMSAVAAKNMLRDPRSEYAAADRAIREAFRYSGGVLNPEESLGRYIEANTQFGLGLSFYGQKDFSNAIAAFERVEVLTPEDGLSRYYLALSHQAFPTSGSSQQTRGALNGDQLSSKAWHAAIQMNPCFQNAGIGLSVH